MDACTDTYDARHVDIDINIDAPFSNDTLCVVRDKTVPANSVVMHAIAMGTHSILYSS